MIKLIKIEFEKKSLTSEELARIEMLQFERLDIDYDNYFIEADLEVSIYSNSVHVGFEIDFRRFDTSNFYCGVEISTVVMYIRRLAMITKLPLFKGVIKEIVVTNSVLLQKEVNYYLKCLTAVTDYEWSFCEGVHYKSGGLKLSFKHQPKYAEATLYGCGMCTMEIEMTVRDLHMNIHHQRTPLKAVMLLSETFEEALFESFSCVCNRITEECKYKKGLSSWDLLKEKMASDLLLQYGPFKEFRRVLETLAKAENWSTDELCDAIHECRELFDFPNMRPNRYVRELRYAISRSKIGSVGPFWEV